MMWSLLIYTLFFVFVNSQQQELPPSCSSRVYCYGNLLHTVQLARKQYDSKSFVDKRMINSEQQTINNFALFMQQTNNNPTDEQVEQFVNNNFEDGNELAPWELPDFQPNPSFVEQINDEEAKNFTLKLIQVWPELARYVIPEVSANQERYSLIPVPNGFIIPGGRFKEYYYWDSYWIVDGLLINEMTETARGIIENFVSIVERFGFVPNGGRVYYLQRSQPPLLTHMAYDYYQYTKDTTWLAKNIDGLAKELNYWIGQIVRVEKGFRTYTLVRYAAASKGPRPESYKEDVHAAGIFEEEARKDELYIDLKSAAESGWDFSGRWIFDADGGNNANLSYINTRRVAPIDLNAFLCGSFKYISSMYADLGRTEDSQHWHELYVEIKTAINKLMWNETDGIWYDYDLELNKHRTFFYPSSLAPLWARCFEENEGQELGRRALEYLQTENVLDYMGGIPSSDDDTGEQWDFPNAWPPLQDIVVRGLENSGLPEALQEAEVLAKRWVKSNIIGFNKDNAMYEKYDAEVPGQYGGGGEYDVQTGFGWSNGIALRFIYNYYRDTGNESDSAYIGTISGMLFWSALLLIKLIQ